MLILAEGGCSLGQIKMRRQPRKSDPVYTYELVWRLTLHPRGHLFKVFCIVTTDGNTDDASNIPLTESMYMDFANVPQMAMLYDMWLRYGRGPDGQHVDMSDADVEKIRALKSERDGSIGA